MPVDLQPTRAETVRARATMHLNEHLSSTPEAHPWWRELLLDLLEERHADAPVWGLVCNSTRKISFAPYGMPIDLMLEHPSMRHVQVVRFPSSVWG